MKKLRQIFSIIILALASANLFSSVARAQGSVSYSFLEVVDFAGKAVPEATVKLRGGCSGTEFTTNREGQLDKGLPIGYGDCNTDNLTISKDSYYPFEDYFGVLRFGAKQIKIELLKIPQTRSERQAIGDEQQKREFFIAAKTGDAEHVRQFLKAGLSPNITTFALRGVPAAQDVPIIVFAAESGNGEIIKEFLKAGVDVRTNREFISDIFVTLLNASPTGLRYPETSAENNPLIDSLQDGAESLIKAGANFNLLNYDKVTTLMMASQRAYPRIVKLLIEKGVPVDARDANGRTALMYLIYRSPQDLKSRFEIVDLLIKSGADPNALSSSGETYFQQCKSPLIDAVIIGDAEMIKFLIANKANINLACSNGDTALTYAKANNWYVKKDKMQEIIKLLEAAGAK